MTVNDVVVLQEGYSPTLGKLASALVKAQGEMPPAKFNATNPFLKNKYADLGSVIETAKPILAKNGLAILQPIINKGNGTIGIRTILMHESGEYMSSEVMLPFAEQKGQTIAQAAGSMISYLRRYSFSSILGMYADEDTDASEDSKTGKKPTKPKSPVKQEEQVVPEGKSWPAYMVKALVDAELANSPQNAVNILNLFPELPRNTSGERVIELGQIYRARRDDNGLSITEATEVAWAEWGSF